MIRIIMGWGLLLIGLGKITFAQSQASAGIPYGIIQLENDSNYFSSHVFVVDKSARTMELWQAKDHGSLIRQSIFPADMGMKDGDKKELGDHKTPEGIYFLMDRLEGTNLDFGQYGSRAFVLNYPNFFDRMIGKTGSGIWLHAVPDKISLSRGSRGCVVVRNDVIKEISQFVKLRQTPILINNSVTFWSDDERKKFAENINSIINQWRSAWQSKNLDNYMKFYSDKFNSMGMNFEQWRKYKEGLINQYQYMNVQLSIPVIFGYKDLIIARLLQFYESDKYSDFGEKTIYIQKDGEQFKILGEEWQEIKNQQIRAHFTNNLSAKSLITPPPEQELKN